MIPTAPKARFLLPLLLVAACGGSGDEVDAEAFDRACETAPGCADARPLEGPTETIWRVPVVRHADGGIEIGAVEPVAVAEGEGVPLGRLAGTHLLVGRNGDGEPVDGQVIAFPTTLRAENADEWSATEVDLSGREVVTVGYVRAEASIEDLAVLDASGATVATAPAPSGGSALRRPASPAALAVGAVPSARAQPSGNVPPLPARCAHVRILEGEADRALAVGAADLQGIRLLVPTPTQRALIHGALGMMTPLLCHGVARIAIVDLPDQPSLGGQVRQLQSGDLLILNVAAGYTDADLKGDEVRRLDFLNTVIHEIAHAAEALLNAEGQPPDAFVGDWTPPSRDLASRTVDHVRLEKGLIIEWQRTHRSFRDQGWAQAYTGWGEPSKVAQARTGAEAVRAGFMSRYGGINYAEDIAEFVVWTYLGDDYAAAGVPPGPGGMKKQDFGCQEMQAHGGDGVPAEFADVYTKLHFVEDLGLVHADDVDRCTGSVSLPNEEPGFHFWEDGQYRRTFGRAVTAVIGTAPSGNYVFEMKAEGEAGFGDGTYPAEARLILEVGGGGTPLEKVSWPRGVYDLGVLAGYDLGNLGNRSNLVRGSGFRVRLEGAKAGNFDVYEGYALVAEASDRRIAGSVVIQRAMRFFVPSPVPIPETWDPPLVVRFAIEK